MPRFFESEWRELLEEERKIEEAEMQLSDGVHCPACGTAWQYMNATRDMDRIEDIEAMIDENIEGWFDGERVRHGYCPRGGCRLWEKLVLLE